MKRTAIARKPARPKKRPANPCSWSSRCKTRAPIVVTPQVIEVGPDGDAVVTVEGERYCKTHAKWVADKLVGDWVKARDRVCQSCGSVADAQWAHVRSRGALYIRWYVGPTPHTPGNSVRLCAKCHQNYTLKPHAWDLFVEERWPGLWTRLVHLELEGERRGDSVDIAEIIREYRERAAA